MVREAIKRLEEMPYVLRVATIVLLLFPVLVLFGNGGSDAKLLPFLLSLPAFYSGSFLLLKSRNSKPCVIFCSISIVLLAVFFLPEEGRIYNIIGVSVMGAALSIYVCFSPSVQIYLTQKGE